MAKTLVLAEKPSVARELAAVLGAKTKGDGCLRGDRYIVTWALGHLVTLAEPEHYGDQYKKWTMDTLPMLPKNMDLKVIPETSKQYSKVKSLLRSKEVDSIIIATDAGREGELVARWIIAKSGVKKPIKRLWISSQTTKAIKEGFSNLKDGKDYLPLYYSAQSRAEADWLVGLNVTRALTCKFNAQLSAGRVQTPTLALLVNREREIQSFKPKDYYTVKADLGKFFVTRVDEKGNSAIYDKTIAEEIQKKINRAAFKVEDIKISKKSVPPPLLYDLTELQRDANKLYKFSPKETLNYMQRLYENHKVLTYPRTDSKYLTADIVPTLNQRLQAISFGELSGPVREILREKRSIAKTNVNDAKVSDHHAIIPTEEKPNLLKMSDEEKKIYFMVLRRFIAAFYPNFDYSNLRITLTAAGESFTAQGKVVVNKGWQKVYEWTDDEPEEDQNLPEMKKGDTFTCVSTQLKTQKTKAPSRYTEASLLGAMENPSKYITDKKMKEFIGGGLGTPATRGDIIEKLYNAFYVEKKDNVMIPTAKAMQLIDLVPTDLKEPLLTAKWEQQLEAIAKGKTDAKSFLADIRAYSASLVKMVANSNAVYVPDNLTRTPCPQCGKMMLEVHGKRGKMLVCQDRECGYRRNVSLNTNARCPNCHKKMELFGEGDKRTYVCPCGFRERAESFHKRHKEAAGGNKREVQSYLKNQNKRQESEELSPLAKALQEAMAKNKK
ncbi:MAG: DNA topoisomerase III [Bacillota bacterium]|nr:DNA topoisomerase III [Bacillota bacterium]